MRQEMLLLTLFGTNINVNKKHMQDKNGMKENVFEKLYIFSSKSGMEKLFFQTLSILGLSALLLIIVWFLMVLLKKRRKVQPCIFLLSHYLLYIDSFFLDEDNMCLIGSIILILTLLAFFIIDFKQKENQHFWVYVLFSVFLFILILYIIVLSQIDLSFLALQH